MQPVRGQVYSLKQVMEMQLPDSPFLTVYENGKSCPIQDSHITKEQLLSIDSIEETRWMYLYTTDEWIPVFLYAGHPVKQFTDFFKIEDKGEWITPIGFYRENPEKIMWDEYFRTKDWREIPCSE